MGDAQPSRKKLHVNKIASRGRVATDVESGVRGRGSERSSMYLAAPIYIPSGLCLSDRLVCGCTPFPGVCGDRAIHVCVDDS